MTYDDLVVELQDVMLKEKAFNYDYALDFLRTHFDTLFKEYDPYGQLYYVDSPLPNQAQYRIKTTNQDDTTTVTLLGPTVTIFVQLGGEDLIKITCYGTSTQSSEQVELENTTIGAKFDMYLDDQFVQMVVAAFKKIDDYHVVDDILY